MRLTLRFPLIEIGPKQIILRDVAMVKTVTICIMGACSP
jgi:hypothetical protein